MTLIFNYLLIHQQNIEKRNKMMISLTTAGHKNQLNLTTKAGEFKRVLFM